VQLCGRFVVELGGRRVEGELPGRQGRLLLAYLVANRARTATREEVLEALRRGDFVGCHLDDAGRAIPPEARRG